MASTASNETAPIWGPVLTLGKQQAPEVIRHLLTLDAASRALRFGCLTTDDRIRNYVGQIDFERDTVFGLFDGQHRLVAMVHLAFSQGSTEAGGVVEFGISVLASQRGRRLGTRLFDHAVIHSRNRGMTRMLIHMARDNAAMLAIVRGAGAVVQFDGPDVLAQLPLPADTLGSQIQEWMGHHLAALRGPANAWPAFGRPAFGHSVSRK
jgi:GNAT superfamily N-acetyltransferase